MLMLKVAVAAACVYAVSALTAPAKSSSQTLPSRKAAVVKDSSGAFTVVDGWPTGAVSTAEFADAVNATGWAFLDVRTNADFSNDDQAYAAGLVEGALTNNSIWLTYLNNGGEQQLPSKVATFVSQAQAWLDKMVQQHASTDDYWQQVALTLRQMDGLYDGYAAAVPTEQRFPKNQVYLANIAGDLETYLGFMTEGADQVFGQDKCSALVKLLPDFSELYFSQVTWSSLNSMLRIFKNYNLAYKTVAGDGIIPGREVSFSSYPSVLFSGDDYYQVHSSQLAVLETTIGNSNPKRWKYVKTTQVFEFFRNVVANRLAVDGKSWSDIFGQEQYQSGTYNNEFLIVDYKKFTPGKRPEPNTLWVLDQIPGLVVAKDATDNLLRQGFQPSYNVPFWPEVFEAYGGPAEVKQGGPWFSYNETARALIFARNQTDITDLTSMSHVMRYNNFKHDPLSAVPGATPPYTSENAIACRDDLNPANGSWPISAFGHRNHAGTDAKITSKALFAAGKTLAISGPTAEQQPVFSWATTTYQDLAHFGHPTEFDFDWVEVSWPADHTQE